VKDWSSVKKCGLVCVGSNAGHERTDMHDAQLFFLRYARSVAMPQIRARVLLKGSPSPETRPPARRPRSSCCPVYCTRQACGQAPHNHPGHCPASGTWRFRRGRALVTLVRVLTLGLSSTPRRPARWPVENHVPSLGTARGQSSQVRRRLWSSALPTPRRPAPWPVDNHVRAFAWDRRRPVLRGTENGPNLRVVSRLPQSGERRPSGGRCAATPRSPPPP